MSALGVGIVLRTNFYKPQKATSFLRTIFPVATKPTSSLTNVDADKNPISKITTTKPKIIISGGDAIFARDLNNNTNLVGESQNVFVGKIIGQTKSGGGNTQFDVRIIKNIKGNLQGTVSVSITGGYSNGIFYLMDGSTWLDAGSTYLLATRYAGGNVYHLISFPAAWKLLSQDSSLADAQLSALAENDPRVQQLEAAYPKETLLPIDVAYHNTSNSYQSLTEAQKAALPYYVAPVSIPTPTSTMSTSTINATSSL